MSKHTVSITPIQTKIYHVKDNFEHFLFEHLKGVKLEGNVLAITSKIVSLAEDQIIPLDKISKKDLVMREADVYLGEGGYGCELTVKHGILIPSAGIDESNSEGGNYILFPKDPYQSAERIWSAIRKHFSLKNFGLIITDSHTTPLRRGVTGIALSHWGIKATRSLIDQPDLFGRPLKFTHVDVIDSLAVMAVYTMGEADDCMPLALVENANVEFTMVSSPNEVAIALEDDLYYPILKTPLKK